MITKKYTDCGLGLGNSFNGLSGLQSEICNFTGNREEMEELYLKIKGHIQEDLIKHIKSTKQKLKPKTSFFDRFKKFFIPKDNKCYNNAILYKNLYPNAQHIIAAVVLNLVGGLDVVLHCYVIHNGNIIDPTYHNIEGLEIYYLPIDKEITNLNLEDILTEQKVSLLRELNNNVVNLALDNFEDFYDCI